MDCRDADPLDGGPSSCQQVGRRHGQRPLRMAGVLVATCVPARDLVTLDVSGELDHATGLAPLSAAAARVR